MTEVFLEVLNRSISASWLVLAVLLLRLLLKKAPKWVYMVLWGMVAFRLLCPLSIENPLSLIPSKQAISEQLLTDTAAPGTPIEVVPMEITPTGQAELPGNAHPVDAAPPADEGISAITVLAALWAVGGLFLLSYFVSSYWRLRRRVSTAVIFRDNIFQSERIRSPFVLGMIKPRIYLPFGIDRRSLEYVISHEQAHIRRRDHWWKPLGFLLLTAYWFNPLMWLSYILLCRDIELACDERVIRGLDRQQRADYSQALLICSASSRSIAACPVAFGEIGVKERVKSVLHYKKPALWIIAAAVVVCAAVAVCFLTDPAQRRDTLVWAQELSAEDIASAELAVLHGAYDTPYKELSENEIATMTALINQSSGKYLTETEDTDGGSTFFYITMKDGSTHEIGNIGNLYLYIDGDFYDAEYDWLASWDDDFGAVIPAESAPAEATPQGTIVWEDADLDYDGEPESICVRETLPGELYELEVVKKDGTVLWSAEAGTAHTGWNTILLYQDGGADYLIEYQPAVYQGMGSYSCRMLTLKGGAEQEENMWTADFELSSLQMDSKMVAFAERANDFLRHGIILLSTVEGEAVIGPKTGEEVPQLYPVQFFPESEELSAPADETALEDFLPMEFLFASGAGAWGTTLTLYPDGRFEGLYEDHDADSTAEHPNGTSYHCAFSGQFGDITKVSEYAYTMRLEELDYDDTELNQEQIVDGTRYIASEPYGMTGGEDFMLYLPGTPLEGLDEEFLSWWSGAYLWRDGSVDILTSYAIQNVDAGTGFFTAWLQ